ncbi:unnamed protein product, partial [Candidula unifasciata]
MLARTGTIIRKQRRRSSATSRTSSRRESATTPTPSICPTPSPSASYNTYNHGGNFLQYHHSSELFASSPFSTPDPSPVSLGGVKDFKFSFDVTGVKSHLTLSKVNNPKGSETENVQETDASHRREKTLKLRLTQSRRKFTIIKDGGVIYNNNVGDEKEEEDNRASESICECIFPILVKCILPLTIGFKRTRFLIIYYKPIYESTVIWAEVEDADPHYSLLGSLCEASIEAKHPCDFIHRAMFIICGTWPVTVFTLVLLALPLVMTAI